MLSSFKPTRFQMQFLGILHRIIKSTLFNILLLIFGFGVGFVHAAFVMHHNAVANSNYEFIVKIEQDIHDLEQMDVHYALKQKSILNHLKMFKCKLSHDYSNLDNMLDLHISTNTHLSG